MVYVNWDIIFEFVTYPKTGHCLLVSWDTDPFKFKGKVRHWPWAVVWARTFAVMSGQKRWPSTEAKQPPVNATSAAASAAHKPSYFLQTTPHLHIILQ